MHYLSIFRRDNPGTAPPLPPTLPAGLPAVEQAGLRDHIAYLYVARRVPRIYIVNGTLQMPFRKVLLSKVISSPRYYHVLTRNPNFERWLRVMPMRRRQGPLRDEGSTSEKREQEGFPMDSVSLSWILVSLVSCSEPLEHRDPTPSRFSIFVTPSHARTSGPQGFIPR